MIEINNNGNIIDIIDTPDGEPDKLIFNGELYVRGDSQKLSKAENDKILKRYYDLHAAVAHVRALEDTFNQSIKLTPIDDLYRLATDYMRESSDTLVKISEFVNTYPEQYATRAKSIDDMFEYLSKGHDRVLQSVVGE